MKLLFSLAISFLVFASYVTVTESVKQHKAQENVPKIEYVRVHDTVLIDKSEAIDTSGKYHFYYSKDSLYIYDAQELLKVLNRKDNPFLDSAMDEVNN